MAIVKTGTIQTERYPEESDLKGSEWADRGRKTVPQTGAQLQLRLIRQSWSISLPKVLSRLRHNVCKELDLHAANFLQRAGDGQKAQSKTVKASPNRDREGLTPPSPMYSISPTSAPIAYPFVPLRLFTSGALRWALKRDKTSPSSSPHHSSQVGRFWPNFPFWLPEPAIPGRASSACLAPCSFPSAQGWVASWTSPGRQC